MKLYSRLVLLLATLAFVSLAVGAPGAFEAKNHSAFMTPRGVVSVIGERNPLAARTEDVEVEFTFF